MAELHACGSRNTTVIIEESTNIASTYPVGSTNFSASVIGRQQEDVSRSRLGSDRIGLSDAVQFGFVGYPVMSAPIC